MAIEPFPPPSFSAKQHLLLRRNISNTAKRRVKIEMRHRPDALVASSRFKPKDPPHSWASHQSEWSNTLDELAKLSI